MFKFIGKFEFKPLSSMYPMGTPEKRRADNVEKALKNPNVRDRVLRKIHKQNFPNIDYEDYAHLYDLENAYRASDIFDEVEDGYDFISDPDYLVEKLDENNNFDIYGLLNTGEYTVYRNNFPRTAYIKIEKLNNRSNESVPSELVNQLKDLQYDYEQSIADFIRGLVQDNNRYTIEDIVKKIKSREINMDQYDSMMDWDRTDSNDIELYLKYLSPNTLEKIKKDYGFDEKDILDKDDIEEQIRSEYPEPHIIAKRNKYKPINLVNHTYKAPKYISQYIYDTYDYPYFDFLNVRDFD